jgi:addiction module HigA family antidote
MSKTPIGKRLAPMHPGEFLREVVIPGAGLPKSRIAARLRLSRQSLYDILGERSPVTARVAMRLGRLFGNSPQFWLNLQAEFDVATLSKAMRKDLERIPPLDAA